jgi:hypothetical protein
MPTIAARKRSLPPDPRLCGSPLSTHPADLAQRERLYEGLPRAGMSEK